MSEGFTREEQALLDELEWADPGAYEQARRDIIAQNEAALAAVRQHTYITIKQERKHIVIGPNPDPQIFNNKMIRCNTYNNLPRPQFLGLLKNCKRFISNSSATIYEAPHFLKPEQIVHIGDRNKNRDKGPFEIGASDKIVKILKEYLK